MGLLELLFGSNDNQRAGSYSNYNDDENVSDYTDEELDNLGLEEWQKKEVKKGNYDPWNFEEEDLEEDDYYYDDADDDEDDDYDDKDDEDDW